MGKPFFRGLSPFLFWSDGCRSIGPKACEENGAARLPASTVFAEQLPPSVGDDGDGMPGGDVRQMILNGQAPLFRKACGIVVWEWAGARFFRVIAVEHDVKFVPCGPNRALRLVWLQLDHEI